jgi:hypothetical protein
VADRLTELKTLALDGGHNPLLPASAGRKRECTAFAAATAGYPRDDLKPSEQGGSDG